VDQRESTSGESRLLLACARLTTNEEDKATIRQILGEGIDWTIFAQTAADRGLVNLAAHTLLRAAPDMVPSAILDALHRIVDQTRSRNREVLDQVTRTVGADAVEGAVLAIQKACATAKRALTAHPNDTGAWRTLGGALLGRGQHAGAIACYGRALELAPEDVINWRDRASAMLAIGQLKAALADIDKALALDLRDTRTWTLRARTLLASGRFAEAVEASARALALDPENTAAVRVGIQSRLFVCDWNRRESDKRRIAEGLRTGRTLITPLHHRAMSDSEAEQLVLAQLRAKTFLHPAKSLWRGERYRHKKIRIAYLSTDFRDHVVADAIAGCFEHHDKTRFETTAISLGPNDRSATRRRIEAAFDRFIDVRTMNDAEVGAIIRELEIDIAIDLNGYSGEARTEILATRPAPAQVNYFGYPGTMGVPFIDYIIAAPWLIPAEHRVHYSEQVVYLPHTYLPSDRKRPAGGGTPSRAEAGLPATGFVFACLHNSFKIGPEMFDIWTRLLHDVENSVFWFLEDNATTTFNLRREAKLRGINPERLVFAPRKSLADHLPRLRLADLFLDTLPYNAHTSASDALWVGLPVLTCPGNTFAGRVAASLLYAAGLPELVTASLVEYEELAVVLARAPERLAAIKEKLKRNRDTHPLFDTARFTRDLEHAYTIMWERQQRGLPATSFAVDCAPAGLA
jgi:protein O-GlcNAc transferase